MANVNDMFNEVTKEQSFYTKATKKEFTPFAKGEYFGHITDVDSKVLDVKGGQYKARLYTYTVEVDAENKKKNFEPGKDDTFESNATGNTGYLKFCETIDVECPTETKTIDGEDVEVQLLPNLTSDVMLGRPVVAFVDKGRPFINKKGEETFFWDCKFCKKWAGGKAKDIKSKDGDLPF